MADRLTLAAVLTPDGRLSIDGDTLEDLAADALLPRPHEGELHRPVLSALPVRITVEPC